MADAVYKYVHRSLIDAVNSSDRSGSLTFAEVKARVIEGIMQLEKLGLVSRSNNFQELLNSLATDIRNKHQKRMRRQAELRNMSTTLASLASRKKYLDEQINQYESYIECEFSRLCFFYDYAKICRQLPCLLCRKKGSSDRLSRTIR
jgi:hypothetical protein